MDVPLVFRYRASSVRDPRTCKPIMIGRITTVKTGPVVYYRIATNDYLNYANLWTDLGSISESRR